MTLDPRAPKKRKPVPRHPQIKTAAGQSFPCFPVSILAFVVDTWDRCLLLRRPGQPGWEVINGTLQAGETVPEAVTREIRQKAGAAVQAVYLGVLDAFTFVFDANLPPAITICCLMRYRGGEIELAGDVRGADHHWWETSQVDLLDLAVPRNRWDLLIRAGEMARYLRDARQPQDDLRGDLVEQEEDWR